MFRAIALSVSLALAGAVPVTAQTPMSAAEFEAFVEGRTLFYSDRGADFGAEEYLPGRRVRWTYLDGECTDGRWYEAGELICFVYEDIPDPQCWTFFMQDDGIAARFENDPDEQPVYSTRSTREPLQCPGPPVGV